jgi:hypothetical protein
MHVYPKKDSNIVSTGTGYFTTTLNTRLVELPFFLITETFAKYVPLDLNFKVLPVSLTPLVFEPTMEIPNLSPFLALIFAFFINDLAVTDLPFLTEILAIAGTLLALLCFIETTIFGLEKVKL